MKGKTEMIKTKGRYAPKTSSYNYFVYLERENVLLGAKQDKVLAHCWAHIRNPERLESIVELIEGMWEMFSPSGETVHPSYKWMEKYLGPFLLE